ncbi:hypothetical protein L1987_31018 [Smallanthus sonchifolius]|uniref:Uncharacterized protein n=1 Tax=Smallanthus sonchifolius TaxID=185202 RepID=A0ACB9I5B4_9ASTR|nr:hypothetical protein L1987_31018 [Smallanthus sonchifolius]
MVPSQSTTHAVAIPVHSPPSLTIPPPQQTSLSPPPSSPAAVDLLSCSHQKFGYRLTRKLKRYLGCFKTQDSNSLEKKAGFKNGEIVAVGMHSPNYYSDMNDEERDEKLKSAIVYCKK